VDAIQAKAEKKGSAVLFLFWFMLGKRNRKLYEIELCVAKLSMLSFLTLVLVLLLVCMHLCF
jgi:hypothetical protein